VGYNSVADNAGLSLFC